MIDPEFLLNKLLTCRQLVLDTRKKALVPGNSCCSDSRFELPVFLVLQHIGGGSFSLPRSTEDVLKLTIRIRGSLTPAELELLGMELRRLGGHSEAAVCYLLNVLRKKHCGMARVLATVYGKEFAIAVLKSLPHPLCTDYCAALEDCQRGTLEMNCTGNCLRAYVCDFVFFSMVLSGTRDAILWLFISPRFYELPVRDIVENAVRLLNDSTFHPNACEWLCKLDRTSRLDADINGPHDMFFDIIAAS